MPRGHRLPLFIVSVFVASFLILLGGIHQTSFVTSQRDHDVSFDPPVIAHRHGRSLKNTSAANDTSTTQNAVTPGQENATALRNETASQQQTPVRGKTSGEETVIKSRSTVQSNQTTDEMQRKIDELTQKARNVAKQTEPTKGDIKQEDGSTRPQPNEAKRTPEPTKGDVKQEEANAQREAPPDDDIINVTLSDRGENVTVTDLTPKSFPHSPQVQYLGVLVDAGRHYFPISWLKNLIDILHRMKFNLIHFRLTDDQAFNVRLESHPELAKPSAVNNPTGAVYSTAELVDLVAYADEKNITIMPEINVPGHAGAWSGIPGFLVPCPEFICLKGYGASHIKSCPFQ